jgi:hypothetical protein
MAEQPPAAADQPWPAAAKDPVQLLVKAIGTLPEAERDRVYLSLAGPAASRWQRCSSRSFGRFRGWP